jgi:hypothetical protein
MSSGGARVGFRGRGWDELGVEAANGVEASAVEASVRLRVGGQVQLEQLGRVGGVAGGLVG